MLQWILRTVVSIAVVTVLVNIASTAGLRAAFSQVSAAAWLISVAVCLGGHVVNAWKYHRLLHDPRATFPLCLRAHFAGLVANLGLPGVAGGDVVRATYLLPHGVRPSAVTVASVADRVVDTMTLFALIAIGALVAGVPAAFDPATVGIRWNVVGAAGLAVTAVAGFVLVGKRRGGGRLADVAGAVRARAGAIVLAVGITAVVQSAFVLTNLQMASDLGVAVGVAPWFVAWPLSKVISILPISLGGIGVREAALVSLLGPYGAPSAPVLVSGLLWVSVFITSALLGLALTSLIRTPSASPPSAPRS